MGKYFCTIILCCLIALYTNAQDAHFSQYNHSKSYTNPAFTGSDSTLNISTAYRIQWPNITGGGYKTFYFSADNYYRWLRGGLGLNYINDNEINGIFIKQRIDFNYAPHFELFKHKLTIQAGLQLSYFQNKVDWSKLVWGDMIDERRGFVYNTTEVRGQGKKRNMDISTGILLYSNHFYGGIAVHHLTQPDEGVMGPSKLPIKYTIHTGANLNFSTPSLTLSPNFLFMKQNFSAMLLPGISAKYKMFALGISYRNQDACIATVGFQSSFLKIAYSYDYTVSKLTNKSTGGSHEMQVTWFIRYRKKVCGIKTLRLI